MTLIKKCDVPAYFEARRARRRMPGFMAGSGAGRSKIGAPGAKVSNPAQKPGLDLEQDSGKAPGGEA